MASLAHCASECDTQEECVHAALSEPTHLKTITSKIFNKIISKHFKTIIVTDYKIMSPVSLENTDVLVGTKSPDAATYSQMANNSHHVFMEKMKQI